MKVAYADPPYIGQGDRYPEKTEVDHEELIMRLCHDYECWALSASSPSIKIIVPILNKMNIDYRTAAWVKPFCSFKPNVNPAFAWEPIFFYGYRHRPRSYRTVRDWVSANITLKKGLRPLNPPEGDFPLERLRMSRKMEVKRQKAKPSDYRLSYTSKKMAPGIRLTSAMVPAYR